MNGSLGGAAPTERSATPQPAAVISNTSAAARAREIENMVSPFRGRGVSCPVMGGQTRRHGPVCKGGRARIVTPVDNTLERSRKDSRLAVRLETAGRGPSAAEGEVAAGQGDLGA